MMTYRRLVANKAVVAVVNSLCVLSVLSLCTMLTENAHAESGQWDTTVQSQSSKSSSSRPSSSKPRTGAVSFDTVTPDTRNRPDSSGPGSFGAFSSQSSSRQQPGTGSSLKGGVQTFESAMRMEQGRVDWYGWYLAARGYIANNGGLLCPLGTLIRFYKEGRMQALSDVPECVYSVQSKNFPLPSTTQLSIIVLPVRNREAPPASQQEIYYRTFGGR